MSYAAGPWLWARSTIRRQWRATIFVSIFAGLAGGAVLTGVEVARRTSSAYERYVRYADVADIGVVACPIGVTQHDLEDSFDACFSEPNAVEVTRSLSSIPGVASVGRLAFGPIGVADRSLPGGWRGTLAFATIDAGAEFSVARPILVAGRLPEPDVADEIAVNEEFLSSGSFQVGDTIDIGTVRAENLSDVEQSRFVPDGQRSSPRIVGVIRLPDDLQPGQSTRGIKGLATRETIVYLPPSWWKAYGSEAAIYYSAMAVWVAPGASPDEVETAINDRFSDRAHFLDSPIVDPTPLTRVVDQQALAAWIIAATLFVAAFVFVGQAIARQLRREMAAHATTLQALGFQRGHTVIAAVLRMAPVAVGGATLAVLGAGLASPLGPIGLARQMEVDPGVHWDLPALALGSLIAILGVLGAAAGVGWRAASTSPTRPSTGRGTVRGWGFLPVTARAGALLTRSAGTRAAVASAFVAIAIGVGAGGVLHSINALESTPRRYGVTWDLTVGAFTSYESLYLGQETAADHPVVAATGAVRSTEVEINGNSLWFIAFDPQSDPAVGPVVMSGRLPSADDEVALGAQAMKILDVDIGDLLQPRAEELAHGGPLTVVGKVVINDNGSSMRNGGAGGVMTNGLFDKIDPFTSPQDVLVRLRPEADLAAAVADLRADFGGIIGLARPQSDIRDLDRIKPQLRAVAPIVILFAATAMTHALITTVRSRRRDLATLRALGFTRGQVATSIACHAGYVEGAALVTAIPIGVITSRWIWNAIESRLGVIPQASIPWLAICLAIGTAALVCGIAALLGRFVTTRRANNALSSE